jgi:electron-transferring-flavoprotein dehydrogenase
MSEEVQNIPESTPLDADIVCVGFGPAMGGFLTTLSRALADTEAEPLPSAAMPGLPPQVVCYERADDIGFGVSGVVTRGRAIRATFPEFNPSDVPMATPVRDERLVYLMDPHKASRRPWPMRFADSILGASGLVPHLGLDLPFTPDFLHKRDGFVASLGQFNQWVGQQVMMSGLVQIWPGTPVKEPLIENGKVKGVVLNGDTPVHAALTVVGDGPVGPVGRRLDEIFGMPDGHARDEWAVGMKIVFDLPAGVNLQPGTVFHTIGYPEPEIFGFFYVHPDRVATAGIFVPSWFYNPARTAYRYLQHFLLHPYIWRYAEGGRIRSWGAKSLLESGRRGEPHLAGDGYARIGEGSGSTNVLTGSGVDEAWLTGTQLAEAVVELMRAGKPFTKANLETAYVDRRRSSWLERESRVAERAREGFYRGVMQGFLGMAAAGFTGGVLGYSRPKAPRPMPSVDEFFSRRLPLGEIERLRKKCEKDGKPLHDALMAACGWPPIPFDGKLIVSHQDALLLGGKVQAPSGIEDHVTFIQPSLCASCQARLCIEICSGEAIHAGENGIPAFDREKCVHCGACIWNCTREISPGVTNIAFAAAPGGLHSAEN